MIHKNLTSLLRRIRGSKQRQRRQRASFKFHLMQLEERRLLSAIPHRSIFQFHLLKSWIIP